LSIEALGVFIGSALAWFVITLGRKVETPEATTVRRARRANRKDDQVDMDSIRQSVDAVYATSVVSKRLLDRFDKIEETQRLEKEKIDEKFAEMEKKIETLTKDNEKLNQRVEKLRLLIFKLTGVKYTTEEIDELDPDDITLVLSSALIDEVNKQVEEKSNGKPAETNDAHDKSGPSAEANHDSIADSVDSESNTGSGGGDNPGD